MSKQRMIRDSFWTDSYIERLTPDEKLLFLYLLTNPLCNVAGVYEIRTKRIGFETGYDIEVVESILGRFERDKKILRHNDWVILVNHIKNQSLNPSIIQGCQRIFDELPPDIRTRVTGWVQAGLLNLTLLNLTLLNSTEKSVSHETSDKSLRFLEEVPVDIKTSLSEKYHISPKGIQQKATDLLLYCKQKGKSYKDYKAFLENAVRKDKIKLQSEYPPAVKPVTQESVELTPEQAEKNRLIREDISNMLRGKKYA